MIVSGIDAVAPGAICTGAKFGERPLNALADQRSPPAVVTVGSNAWVTAEKVSLAVAEGAPLAGYGPSSLGLSAQSPEPTVGVPLKSRDAVSPEFDSCTCGAGTAGERSGSPPRYSMS